MIQDGTIGLEIRHRDLFAVSFRRLRQEAPARSADDPPEEPDAGGVAQIAITHGSQLQIAA